MILWLGIRMCSKATFRAVSGSVYGTEVYYCATDIDYGQAAHPGSGAYTQPSAGPSAAQSAIQPATQHGWQVGGQLATQYGQQAAEILAGSFNDPSAGRVTAPTERIWGSVCLASC
jgi:hypothetical protein